MRRLPVGEKVYIKGSVCSGYDKFIGRVGLLTSPIDMECLGVTIDGQEYWMCPEDIERSAYNVYYGYCHVCNGVIFRVEPGQAWCHNDTDMMQSKDSTHFATTKEYGRHMNSLQSCSNCGSEIAYDHSVDVWYHIESGDRACLGCNTYAAYTTSKALFVYSVVATVVGLLAVALLWYMSVHPR